MKVVMQVCASLVMLALTGSAAHCQDHRLAGASPTMSPATNELYVSAEIVEIDNTKLKAAGIELYPAMKSATAKHIDSFKVADFIDRMEAARAAERLFTTDMPIKSHQESYTRHDGHLLEVTIKASTNDTLMQVNVKTLNGEIARTFELPLPNTNGTSIVVNPGWASLTSDLNKTYCLLFRTYQSGKAVKATTVSIQRVKADRYDISAKHVAIDRKAARKIGIDYSLAGDGSQPVVTNGLALGSFMKILRRESIANQTFFPLVSLDPNELAYTHLAEQGSALDCQLQSIVDKDSSNIQITITRKTPEATSEDTKSVTYTLDVSTNKTYTIDVNTLFDTSNSNTIEHTVVVSIDCVNGTAAD